MARPIILQIKDIYYDFLGVFSVLANFLTILILSRGNCGLSKCISVYMVAMATADLLVITFHILVFQIFCYHFPHSFLSYTAVCKSIHYINAVTLDLSVWFTAVFTFDRFVTICCQKVKTKYCTVRTASAVLTTVLVLECMENIPFAFSYEPQRIINNVAWGCRASEAFYSSPAGKAYLGIQNILVPWIPLALILLFNCLTVRRIVVSSRARKGLRGHGSENQSDPEMDSRRKSIILLFTVSASFILLWLTCVVSNLKNGLAVYYKGEYETPAYILAESGFMLMYLNSCINTCIYAATQTKFRQELVKMLKSPWTLILMLVNKINN